MAMVRPFRTSSARSRTPKNEVLQHIIDDLKFASENLPETPKCKPGQTDPLGGVSLVERNVPVSRKSTCSPGMVISAEKQRACWRDRTADIKV